MQTLNALTIQDITRQGQDVVWVLSVQWPDGRERYAHRRTVLSDTTIPATLLEPGTLMASHERGMGPNAQRCESRLKISLALDGPETPSIRERLAQTDPEGLEVTWGVVFLSDQHQVWLGDAVILFYGIIERATVNRLSLDLECGDFLSVRGSKRFGREMEREDLPETDSPLEGRMLPWIFGSIDKAQLLPWRAGTQLLLLHDVKADDTMIAIESVDGLPESGAVQVGDERLEYDQIDAVNKTLGTPLLPLRRTQPANHAAASPARLIPANGFEWLVAGHPCLSVSQVRADALPIAADDFTVSVEDFAGETIQKIAMPQWPAQVTYNSSVSTAHFNGKTRPGCWSLLASTALNGGFAFDSTGEATAAELNNSAKSLAVKWRGELKEGAKRYGTLETAQLRVRVETSQIWETTTHLNLAFSRGATQSTATLTRPSPDNSNSSLRYGPVDFYLDLTDLATAQGWDLFDGSGENGFEAHIELGTGGDPTRFFIRDIELEIGYRARGASHMADTITAAVEGVMSNGVLIENPSDIVKFFLCDPAGLGLSDTEHLELVSFIVSADLLEALGYRFSNRIDTTQPIVSILSRLLFESRCRLVASGSMLMLRFDEGDSPLRNVNVTFNGQNILRGDSFPLERTAEGDLLRAVSLHYGCDFSGGQGQSWRRSLLRDAFISTSAYQNAGVEISDNLQWHNHGDPEVVADLACNILGRYGFRAQYAEFRTPFTTIALEITDCVALQDQWFPLSLDQGEVESLSVESPNCCMVRTRFALLGSPCWSHDSRTFMRHRSSGRLLEFWINGTLVATIDWRGNCRLLGKVTDDASLSATLNAAMVYNSSQNCIYFGTGGSGVFTPRFAIDGSGNLLIAGTLAENISRDDISLGSCNTATPTEIAIGIAEALPVMVFDVAGAALQVRGTLAENERFS